MPKFSQAVFSPDNSMFAVVLDNKTVQLWDLAVQSRPMPQSPEVCNHRGSSKRIVVSSKANKAAFNMLNDVQLWDSKTGKLQGVIERSYRLKFRILSSVRYDSYVSWSSVSDESTNMTTYKTSEYFNRHTLFSHDGHFLLTYDLRQAELWETETGKLIWRTSHHFESSGKWSFSPDGKLLAHLYKVRYRYGDDLPCANWKNAIEIDPDCPDEPPIITIWDLRTNAVLYTISGFHTSFLALEFSPDSTMFACIRKDAGLHSKGESRVLEIWATAGFRCIVQSTLVNVVLPLVWSPDGKTIGCFLPLEAFSCFKLAQVLSRCRHPSTIPPINLGLIQQQQNSWPLHSPQMEIPWHLSIVILMKRS